MWGPNCSTTQTSSSEPCPCFCLSAARRTLVAPGTCCGGGRWCPGDLWCAVLVISGVRSSWCLSSWCPCFHGGLWCAAIVVSAVVVSLVFCHGVSAVMVVSGVLSWQSLVCCHGSLGCAVMVVSSVLSWQLQSRVCCHGSLGCAVMAVSSVLSWQSLVCCHSSLCGPLCLPLVSDVMARLSMPGNGSLCGCSGHDSSLPVGHYAAVLVTTAMYSWMRYPVFTLSPPQCLSASPLHPFLSQSKLACPFWGPV